MYEWYQGTHAIQQRSEANSILLHHRDIQCLLQVHLRTRPNSSLTLAQENEESTIQVLAKSGVAEQVEIDENGGKPLTYCSRMVDS